MTRTTSGDAFAAANAAMVQGIDGASTVHVLLTDCVGLLGADAAGVLVTVDGRLELLAATSHRAIELELHQALVLEGPCVEAIKTGAGIAAVGQAEIAGRWPSFASAMSDAGLESVVATPMRWHQRVLGGLNLFWRTPRTPTQDERELAQAFADIATLALMQSPDADHPGAVGRRLQAALRGRVVIERAKGVLAQTDDLAMDEAFARLVEVSEQTARPLAQVAQSILDDIVARRP